MARSSAKAEYRALVLGVCEGIWLERLLKELQVESRGPIAMRTDSQSAMRIVKNLVPHDRTKHVEVDRQFISERATS